MLSISPAPIMFFLSPFLFSFYSTKSLPLLHSLAKFRGRGSIGRLVVWSDTSLDWIGLDSLLRIRLEQSRTAEKRREEKRAKIGHAYILDRNEICTCLLGCLWLSGYLRV